MKTEPIFIPPTPTLTDLRQALIIALNNLAARVRQSAFQSNIDASNYRLTNLEGPLEGRDAVNRDYLETQLRGVIGLIPTMDRSSDVPTGVALPYAGTAAPAGWLLCDGAAVSRISYGRLFGIIGTAFGAGDGSTTFNLPDLRGRYPLGKDNMGGVSANRVTATEADNLGQGAGAEAIALAEVNLPSHVHGIGTLTVGSESNHTHSYNAPGPTAVQTGAGSTGGGAASTTGTGSAHIHPITGNTGATGSGTAHANVPPYQTFNYIIRT